MQWKMENGKGHGHRHRDGYGYGYMEMEMKMEMVVLTARRPHALMLHVACCCVAAVVGAAKVLQLCERRREWRLGGSSIFGRLPHVLRC